MRGLAEGAAALARGEITAEAWLDDSLARIRRFDPALNSFVFVDEAGARRAARESDARRRAGAALGPLDGAPISVKDSLLVAGMPATWGSRSLRHFTPEQDELPVARLRAAGAVLVGKTNAPELTLEGYTGNDLFGVTRNPWNLDLTPGGSSGGAAASVAAGFVAAALGTDGGGSTRRPACHTGLVGFKPSIGRYPRLDGFPVVLADLEVAGVLAPSVEDVRLLDAVLSGPDPRDRRSLFAAAPTRAAGPARILYLPRFGDAPVDPEVAQATAAFADALADAGHVLLREPLFFAPEDAARALHVISRAGVAWLLTRDDGRIGRQLGAAAQAMAQEGETFSAADYVDALDQVAALRRRCAEVFAGVDFVATPSVAALPWAAATPYPDRIDGRPAGPRDHAVFAGWVNVAGLPGISLPIGLSRAGLPIGAQLVAGFGADVGLLDFAQTLAVPRLVAPLSVAPLTSAPR